MAITKRVVNDKIEILADGQMQVRTATIIEEDGVELSRSFHRHVVDVGADTTNEDQDVKDIASVAHTAERITARAAFKAAQE